MELRYCPSEEISSLADYLKTEFMRSSIIRANNFFQKIRMHLDLELQLARSKLSTGIIMTRRQ